MLPPNLAKLRQSIVNDRNQIGIQKELLAELDKLDRVLGSISTASTVNEVRAKLLSEGLETRLYAGITSGPGLTCQCCGRTL